MSNTSSNLNLGGSPSIMQRMSGIINLKTIGIVAFIILLIIISYYTYKNYTNGATKFYANNENMPKENSQASNYATLMMFYVDWCPHCKTAKPEWDSLKSEYDGKNINGYIINFDEYNCTNESDETTQLMDKYKIEGFPTIKLIKDGEVIEYDAKPTKTTLEQFLNTVL